MLNIKKAASQKPDALADFKESWRRAMAEIGAGKRANAVIETELVPRLAELERLVEEARRLYGIAQQADQAAAPRLRLKTQPAATIPAKKKMSKAERSQAIKNIAATMVSAPDGEVNVREVAKAIQERGINLDTLVPGTMIGNVLNRSPEWNRVEKGIFRYVGTTGKA